MKKAIIAVLFSLVAAATVSAQTTVFVPPNNTTSTVTFAHDGVNTDKYKVCTTPTTGNPTCIDVGKPLPAADGTITVPLQPLVPGRWVLTIQAIGLGGTVSSDPIIIITTPLPAKPATVRVNVKVEL